MPFQGTYRLSSLLEPSEVNDTNWVARLAPTLTSRGGGPAAPQGMLSRVDLTRLTSFSSSLRPCSALSPAAKAHSSSGKGSIELTFRFMHLPSVRRQPVPCSTAGHPIMPILVLGNV